MNIDVINEHDGYSTDENEIISAHDFQALKQMIATNSELRESLGLCPLCNRNIEDRVVSLYKGLICSLYDVYVWCGQQRKHEFETKEIKHLLGKNEYARFGDLVRFGGIVYKPKEDGESRKALYGINMFRAAEFFAGERDIPVQIVLNQITDTIEHEIRVKVDGFPDLKKFLDANGLYDSRKLL